VAKTAKSAALNVGAVRSRRAYFDCRFGQLHVRTAFPTTGGFDEQVTLLCLHAADGSSRSFGRFLPLMAEQRSVYAPDLPGSGESDPPSQPGAADLAAAALDLARDLRLRQIDVLGLRAGAAVAVEIAIARPELVRRLILVGAKPEETWGLVSQPTLVMSIDDAAAVDERGRNTLRKGTFVHFPEYADDLFDAAPQTLAKQFAEFLHKTAPT
jgi:pimeloyl-ACP methyl ester carboxylesterase